MADQYIGLGPDGTGGKKVQAYENLVSGNVVEAQAMVVVDTLGAPVGLASEATLSSIVTTAAFNSRINTLGQKAMANSTPVVLASDQSAIPVTGTFWQATQPVSGTFWQATQPVMGTKTNNNAVPGATNLGALVAVASTAAPTYVDGNLVALSTDLTGALRISGGGGGGGGSSFGSAFPATGTAIGASDGTNMQGLLVESSSNKNLRISLYNGANEASVSAGGAVKVDGSAVTQPVSGTFWQATQPVSGTVTTSPPANASSNIAQINGITPLMGNGLTGTGSQRVTIASDNTAFSVNAIQSGTWNVNNISGTVTLPTGASTSAKQPALGTAGSAATDVLTVQGIASMTALKVDGSAVTQPVSGTFWQATQPVSGTFWQATQPVSGTVTANIGTSGSLALDATLTGGTQQSKITDGSNIAAVKAASTAAGAADPALVVAISPNNTVAATQSGTWTVQPGNTANTTAWRVEGIKADSAAVGTTRPVMVAGFGSDSNIHSLAVDALGNQYVIPMTDFYNQHSNATITANGSVIFSNCKNKDVVVFINVKHAPTGTSPQLFFTIQDIDPDDQVTPVGTAVRGPTISAITSHQIYFKANSSYMQLSWTISGTSPSFTQVSSTIVSKPGDNSISLANIAGKAIVGAPGTLASSATTADQVIATYTVTTGKTFFLQQVDCSARLTTFASTATFFGTASLETPGGTKIATWSLVGSGTANTVEFIPAEPMAIASGTVVRLVCTPSASTAITWNGNLIGFER